MSYKEVLEKIILRKGNCEGINCEDCPLFHYPMDCDTENPSEILEVVHSMYSNVTIGIHKRNGVDLVEERIREYTRKLYSGIKSMNIKEYQELAMMTRNDNLNDNEQLTNAALGLTGESGEFADLVKKIMYQGKRPDKEKLKSELGDVLWYVALACYVLETDMETVMQGNIDKLRKRYSEGFSEQASEARVDV